MREMIFAVPGASLIDCVLLRALGLVLSSWVARGNADRNAIAGAVCLPRSAWRLP